MITGLLIDTATVYTPAVSGGAWTVTAQASLKCRLSHSSLPGAALGDFREEAGGQHILLWDPTYTMPSDAQLLISSERWNVVEGTQRALRGPMGTIVFRRCLVVRAET